MDIKKIKPLIINISLFFLSIILVLVILEIFIRIFLPSAYRHQQIYQYVYHPQAGYQLEKNYDQMVDSGNGPIHVITNEYGYIGQSFPIAKPANEFRIANFGDSYVEGIQMVDWDKTFVALMEENLNAEIQEPLYARSLNFGIGGRGTVEEFWTYKYIVQKARPDLNILWFTLANDFGNNYLPVNKYASLSQNRMGTVKYLLKKSALVSFVFEYLKDNLTFISILQRFGLSNRVVYTGDINIDEDEVALEDKINYSIKTEMKEIQERAYLVTEELLKNFKELVEQNNEKFLVVIIPEIRRLYPDLGDEFFEIYPKASRKDYDFSKAVNQLLPILEKNKIDYIDLTDFIKRYDAQETNIEYCGDLFKDHLTPCGHRALAKFISQFILKHYLPAS